MPGPINHSKTKKLSNKNNSILVTPETLVFVLPFFPIDIKNKKNNNYEKISSNLKYLFNFRNMKINQINNNDKNVDKNRK